MIFEVDLVDVRHTLELRSDLLRNVLFNNILAVLTVTQIDRNKMACPFLLFN